ncbi:MAG TPA: hypothetical protein VFI43_08700 [Nitrosospira sp.]|nr:hypothetical protein [Nitrosospira sp.]
MKGLLSVSSGSKKVWAGAVAVLIFGLGGAAYAAGGTSGSDMSRSSGDGEGSGRTMGGAPKGKEPSLGSQRPEDPIRVPVQQARLRERQQEKRDIAI